MFTNEYQCFFKGNIIPLIGNVSTIACQDSKNETTGHRMIRIRMISVVSPCFEISNDSHQLRFPFDLFIEPSFKFQGITRYPTLGSMRKLRIVGVIIDRDINMMSISKDHPYARVFINWWCLGMTFNSLNYPIMVGLNTFPGLIYR